MVENIAEGIYKEEDTLTLDEIGEMARQCGKNINETERDQDSEKKRANGREKDFKKIENGQLRTASMVAMRRLFGGINVRYKG